MWNEEYDVVIIGSGFAGLAAAIEARRTGSSVIVLEKMAVPGGNSTISGGLFAAAGSLLQAEGNIDDSPELLLADMLAAGRDFNHLHLARIVAEKSNETLLWSIHELGVKYKPRLTHLGGHSVPRTYSTANTSGSGIIKPMLVKCREMNITLRLKNYLSQLIVDESGVMEGVEVREDYIFPNRESGSVKHIRAKKAVVLAAGGFSQDKEFRTIQNPMLTGDIECTNHRGATAESLIMALKTGATPVQLSMIQLGPWASRDEEGFGVGSMFSMLAGFPYGILIDLMTGERFVNEQADRKLLVDAMLSCSGESIAIVDEMGVRHASTLDQCLKRGVVRKFDTIEELAMANQVPLAILKHTIDSYNAIIEQGRDDNFGKLLPRDLLPMRHPPYYSINLISKVHHCMGGIRVNTQAQVLRIGTDQPIGRFYAAGEIVGGIHGASRLGSNAIPECLIFGRIAGANAAGETSRT